MFDIVCTYIQLLVKKPIPLCQPVPFWWVGPKAKQTKTFTNCYSIDDSNPPPFFLFERIQPFSLPSSKEAFIFLNLTVLKAISKKLFHCKMGRLSFIERKPNSIFYHATVKNCCAQLA